MPETIELMWLAYLLVTVGGMGVGWTLIGWLQHRQKADVSSERQEW